MFPKWFVVLGCALVPLPSLAQTIYTVQPGDTLYQIARTQATSVVELIQRNPQLQDPDRLAVGQKLMIKTKVAPPVAAVVTPPQPRRPLTLTTLPNRGVPGNREGAAAIGCGKTYEPPLTVLVPQQNLGLTSTAQPTFFWVTPKLHWQDVPLEKVPQLAFSLWGMDGTLVFKTVFRSHGMAEVTRLTLPTTAPRLAMGQTYRWTVSVLCNPKDTSEDALVEARIQHALPVPELQSRLATAPLAEQGRLFALAGFWYDMLRVTADLQERARWTELLTREGLGAFTQPPLLCWQGEGLSTAPCPNQG
ncbi:DUF928 domain-containing protein [Candidatus Cyanaurora vandensis]|uniref:DUF928 domain-containing protein n=1 Tax=Candidatus Cyanaurora vandensis TaxID=2714958 RepID=UPI00257F8B96|nr:DUF928 domain-containing protein [Candidatus Cyanaurora vandensis]